MSPGAARENIGTLAVLKLQPPDDFVSLVHIVRATVKPLAAYEAANWLTAASLGDETEILTWARCADEDATAFEPSPTCCACAELISTLNAM